MDYRHSCCPEDELGDPIHVDKRQQKFRKKMPLVILGNFIHSLSIEKLEVFDQNGLMVINSHGKIVCLESSADSWTEQRLKNKLKSCLIEDCFEDQQQLHQSVNLISLGRGEFFMPGFIDTHTHAVQYQNIGIGQQYELLDWLRNVTFAEEMRFEDELYAKRMFEKVVSRLVKVGTTTCCYYSSIHLEAAKILAQVCSKAGQRAFIGKCNMDRNDSVESYKEPSAEQSVQDTINFINFVRNELPTYCSHLDDHSCIQTAPAANMVQPILTPRFAISCTDELLGKLGELMKADQSLPLQTHLSESLSEIEFTKKLFPNCSTYSEIYDSFGLLTQRTILAHCIYLEPSEVKLLTERNCGLSHCPTSNFNLSSGICEVRKLMKAGIQKIGLGTDVSGGYGVGILTSIRAAASAAKASNYRKQDEKLESNQLSIENLLYLATLGGAKVCNLEHTVGNFEIGKHFDGLLIQTGAESDSKAAIKPDIDDADLSPEFVDWLLASRSQPYQDGLNPNFFIDNQAEAIDVVKLLEKFLFTGDDRNIGSVFINSVLVGGSRPIFSSPDYSHGSPHQPTVAVSSLGSGSI